MTPDWYDLLDVPRDADTDTIRAAWKAAVADLDPTDRTFRVYSQAAAVLLDDERRAAYDEQLVAEEAGEELEGEEPGSVGVPEAETKADAEPEPEPEPQPEPEPDAALGSAAVAAAGERRGAPGWLLAGVGLLALLVAAGAFVLHVTAPNDPSLRQVLAEVAWWEDDVPTTGDVAVPPGAEGAVEAAERAVERVLGYDHRRLDEDQAAAHELMTEKYAEKYDQLFEGVIRENAIETQTVVSVSQVVASAVSRTGDGRAEVLLFFDRRVTNKARSAPREFEDQATFTMTKVDGRWLVDDVQSTPQAG